MYTLHFSFSSLLTQEGVILIVIFIRRQNAVFSVCFAYFSIPGRAAFPMARRVFPTSLKSAALYGAASLPFSIVVILVNLILLFIRIGSPKPWAGPVLRNGISYYFFKLLSSIFT
jgi:hypothetical protein